MEEEGSRLVLTNCRLLDVDGALAGVPLRCVEGARVLVRGGRVAAVSTAARDLHGEDTGPEVVDCGGRLLVPGLVDCHVHCTAWTADLRAPAAAAPTLTALRAVPILRGMLQRGFTTVRDCGGADAGLAEAVAEGTVEGPSVVFCGKALSQTGGHGDFRAKGEAFMPLCRCCEAGNMTIGRVCDGEAACRAAVRDEVRKGAGFIKVMASGGVASPTDRITNLQFSQGELAALVEEARNAGLGVAAHAYTPDAIRRAVAAGVTSIEHGNYADDETIAAMRAAGTFLVPTLITYERLIVDGEKSGMPKELVAKVADLVERGVDALRRAQAAGVRVAYGSDLLGAMHPYQAHGIGLHLRAQDPEQVWRSLTTVGAQLLGLEGQIGVVKPGARADLLLVDNTVSVDGVPDPSPLQDSENIRLIVKGGRVVKDTLPEAAWTRAESS